MTVFRWFPLLMIAVGCQAADGADLSDSTSSGISVVVPDAAVLTPAGNEIIRIQSHPRVAGAIDSLQWGGQEFINSTDHGRQLQVAYVLDNRSECYNPTEAGSYHDDTGASSSSVLRRYEAKGNVITSEANPAFWLAPGTKHPAGDACAKAFNTTTVSRDVISKRVEVGALGLRHVIRFDTEVELSESHSAFQLEGATGYLRSDFTQLYAYDLATQGVTALGSAPYGEQGGPVIVATASGAHAMGAWSPKPTDAATTLSYGRGYFGGPPDHATSKWTVIFRRGATSAGTFRSTVYIAVGSLENVRVALRQTYDLVGPTGSGSAAAPSPAAAPGAVAPMYRGWNGRSHSFSLDAGQLAGAGFKNEGVGFYVSRGGSGAAQPIFQCHTGEYRFISGDSLCEGFAYEGPLGYLFTNPGAGTGALHRCTRGGDHLYTRDAAECVGDYLDEGVLGYAPDGNR